MELLDLLIEAGAEHIDWCAHLTDLERALALRLSELDARDDFPPGLEDKIAPGEACAGVPAHQAALAVSLSRALAPTTREREMAVRTSRHGADLVVRPMTRPELDVAVEWAADEGWNPGLKDADCFHRTDPDGFLMGFRDGEPVASISVVRYDGAFGFLGFYIVRPKFRGLGYGWRIWQDGMKRLSGRTIGLDGVVAQQANYAKSGFVLAHRSVRYAGDVQVEPPSDPRLETIGSDLVPGVIAYDRPFFPTGREGFLQCWLAPDCRKAVALLEDGEIEGYGVIRACRTGHKIGPLFARSEADADVLFRALAAVVQGGPIFLDVPEPNRAAVKLGGRYGFRPVFETARMYRGPEPSLPLDRIYGITTFELG